MKELIKQALKEPVIKRRKCMKIVNARTNQIVVLEVEILNMKIYEYNF